MEPQPTAAPPADDDVEYEYLDEDRYGDEFGDDDPGDGGGSGRNGRYGDEPSGTEDEPFEFDPQRIPFAAALALKPICDLERDIDHNGDEIFVEAREEGSDRPRVWYKRDARSKNFTRWERGHSGTLGTAHGPSPYLPRDRSIMTGGP